MEGHARFQHRPVARTKAHGPLAPVGRIAGSDRIAAAAVLLDTRFTQHCEERMGDVFAGIARLRCSESRLDSFHHCALGIDEMPWWLAEVHRARLRTVIALEASGDFEERT